MIPRVSSTIATNQNHLLSWRMPQKPPGSDATTEAKMSIDMPLPIPRWEIISPIHMSTAVPATRVGMIRYPRGQMPSGSSGTDGACTAEKNAPPPPVPKRNTSTVACRVASAMVT